MNRSIFCAIILAILIFPRTLVGQSRFAASAELDSLWGDYSNTSVSARAIEDHQAQRYERILRRINSNTIRYYLSNGDSATLYDGDNADGDNAYYFREYLKSINCLLFRVQLGEGNYFLLVNLANGVRSNIDELPVISPDCIHFVTSSFGEPGYTQQRVQIWRVNKDTLIVEATIDSSAVDARWRNNSTIEIVWIDFTNDFTDYERRDGLISLTQNGWKVK